MPYFIFHILKYEHKYINVHMCVVMYGTYHTYMETHAYPAAFMACGWSICIWKSPTCHIYDYITKTIFSGRRSLVFLWMFPRADGNLCSMMSTWAEATFCFISSVQMVKKKKKLEKPRYGRARNKLPAWSPHASQSYIIIGQEYRIPSSSTLTF